jgi:hypothetical protein
MEIIQCLIILDYMCNEGENTFIDISKKDPTALPFSFYRNVYSYLEVCGIIWMQ